MLKEQAGEDRFFGMPGDDGNESQGAQRRPVSAGALNTRPAAK